MTSDAFSYRRFVRRFVVAAAAVAAAAGIFAVASTTAARSARREAETRPIILLLHGRGQLGRDTARVRAEWQNALETGIWTLTKQPLIATGDVRLVWYADILDPASSAGCDADVQSRRARSPRAGSPGADRGAEQDEGDVLGLLLGVTSALFTSLYESMPAESRDAMRALVGDVLYLGDRWRRCAVDRRLESALGTAGREGRPIILIAHSFGSLVAYSFLRTDPTRDGVTRPAIHRFVTLGSMLGIPELQELLLGRAGPLTAPTGVRSWVNVRHVRDPFAASLADSAQRRGRTSIREVVTSGNAVDPHDITTYLRDAAAARAIAWAWCDAFVGSPPAACGELRGDVP